MEYVKQFNQQFVVEQFEQQHQGGRLIEQFQQVERFDEFQRQFQQFYLITGGLIS